MEEGDELGFMARCLLFDENLSTSPKTLSGQLRLLLERKGWSCISVHEVADLAGQPDEKVIDYAKRKGYALLTLDKRMAYLAVKSRVDVYLVLHEKHSSTKEEGQTGEAETPQATDLEELTVVHLQPFATVQARTTFHVRLHD